MYESGVIILKLNQECIRDLLLYLENNLSYTKNININSLSLKDYSQEELIYTADKLNEANYINCIKSKGYEIPFIIATSITYNGHKFIDNVRDNKVWVKTKGILKGFESLSVDIISETASKVITNIINQQLNL